MKLKTRLRLNSAVSLFAVLVIVLSLGWSLRELLATQRDMDLVDEMRRVAFERILLRDSYLLHQEDRSRKQWYVKSKMFGQLLDTAEKRFERENEKAVLQAARKDFEATLSGFSRVMEGRRGQSSDKHIKLGFRDAESRLISQVFLKAYSLYDNINRLHESIQRTAKQVRNRATFIVVFFTLGVISVIFVNSIYGSRTLVRRIAALSKGVECIGSGDLDYCIAVEGDDEFAALARASNEMAAKLKQSFTSIERLQKEIAERRRVEDQLKGALSELQCSNKDLEQFAYVASHDLQEPLRMVATYTQLLAERYKDQLDDKAQKFINYAVDGAVRMQLLINDLLSYSRIGTRGQPLEVVDVHAALGKAISNLKMQIDETSAIITNDELPEVRADASQFVLLFQNLIGNAIKFHGEQSPRIHISAIPIEKSRIEGSGSRDKPETENPKLKTESGWIFSVRDNGIGIEPQYADKVFVIFQRLHTKEEYPGSGIGLAICNKIVERHGGRIWFESEIGKGTTFYFMIPT